MMQVRYWQYFKQQNLEVRFTNKSAFISPIQPISSKKLKQSNKIMSDKQDPFRLESSESSQNQTDPFANDDFNIEIGQNTNFGKRTGKLFQPQKWKRKSDGYFDYEIQEDQRQVSEKKLNQIRERLGLRIPSSDSQYDTEYSQSSSEDQSDQKNVTKSQPINKQINDKKSSRKSENDNFLDSFQENEEPEKSPQPSEKKTAKNGKRVTFEQKSDKQSKKNQQVITMNKNTNENRTKNKQKQTYTQKELKEPIKRLIKESQKIELYDNSQSQENESLSSKNQKSFEKQFVQQLSSIKKNRNSSDNAFSPQSSIESFVYYLEGKQSNQETGELNRAIVNTDSQINSKDPTNQQKVQQQKSKGFKKNKNSTNGNPDDIKQGFKNSKQQQPSEQQKLKMELRRKKTKQQSILTESLRKKALQYHEQQERKLKQQKQKQRMFAKQAEKKKMGKRDRVFQDIQTTDILNFEKLDQQIMIEGNKKAAKKLKTNQKQKDVRIQREKKVYSKIREDEYSSDEFENQFSESHAEQQKLSKKKQKQQKIKINNKIVKDIDKKLKKKDRPQRASPIDRKKLKKKQSKSLSLQKQLANKLKKQKAYQNKDIEIDGNNAKQPSQNQHQRYPKRNRIGRLNYWQGQRAVYDAQRNLIQIQTKEVHKMIGFIPDTFSGELIVESSNQKQNVYVERIVLDKQLLMDFQGFNDQFQELQISYQKYKGNSDRYGKYIEIYQNGELQNLKQPAIILPNSGTFTIQNIGRETGYIQLTLIKNLYYNVE